MAIALFEKTVKRFRMFAVIDHNNYPQYDGYFDHWILAQCVSRRVHNYKGGSCLVMGRWVLASPDLKSWYDPDNGHICSIEPGALAAVV